MGNISNLNKKGSEMLNVFITAFMETRINLDTVLIGRL